MQHLPNLEQEALTTVDHPPHRYLSESTPPPRARPHHPANRGHARAGIKPCRGMGNTVRQDLQYRATRRASKAEPLRSSRPQDTGAGSPRWTGPVSKSALKKDSRSGGSRRSLWPPPQQCLARSNARNCLHAAIPAMTRRSRTLVPRSTALPRNTPSVTSRLCIPLGFLETQLRRFLQDLRCWQRQQRTSPPAQTKVHLRDSPRLVLCGPSALIPPSQAPDHQTSPTVLISLARAPAGPGNRRSQSRRACCRSRGQSAAVSVDQASWPCSVSRGAPPQPRGSARARRPGHA